MRTTVTIDDELLAKAAELTGVTESGALLRRGLQTLVRVESGRRLATMWQQARRLVELLIDELDDGLIAVPRGHV